MDQLVDRHEQQFVIQYSNLLCNSSIKCGRCISCVTVHPMYSKFIPTHNITASYFRIPPEILSTELRCVLRIKDIRIRNTLLSLHEVGLRKMKVYWWEHVYRPLKEIGYASCILNFVSQIPVQSFYVTKSPALHENHFKHDHLYVCL